MQPEFMNKLGAVLSIVVGLVLMLLHKRMAGFCMMMWRKNCSLKPPSEVGYQVGCLLGGILFLVVGVLTLLGILK